jgi:hypothetical protein
MIKKYLTNRETLFNTAVFFFIILVFLSFFQRSNTSYESANIKFEGKEIFFQLDNKLFKEKISNELSSKETYSAILDRKCEITNQRGDRHKVRWLKNLLMLKIYSTASTISTILPYYLAILIHSILVFLTFIILNRTFNLPKKYSFFFLLFYTFIFQQALSEYSYSVFETFFFSLVLFASKNKKFYIYLLSCCIAALNRESGFLFLICWLIFNKDYFKFLYASFITLFTFVGINFDIFSCLLEPKFFVPIAYEKGQINFQDILGFNLTNIISSFKLFFINFVLPFGCGFYFLINTKSKNLLIIFMYIVYLLIFIIATPIHHISIRLVLLPLIFVSIYYYEIEKKFN